MSRTIESILAEPRFESIREQWLIEEIPEVIGREDLLRVHSADYVEGLYDIRLEQRLMEAYELIDSEGNYNRYNPANAQKPLSGMRDDILKVLSGSYLAVNTAVSKGFCYYLGGVMHHGHPDFGHGFCPVNDVAAAAAKARAEGLADVIWIIDTDAHRGDGTADIFSSTPEIKTLSIHMANGWPLDGKKYLGNGQLNPAWIPGDVDIPIEKGADEYYIPRLLEGLETLEKSGLPDLAIVVAGVDPFEKDELPSSAPLALTKEQLLSRDQAVYQFLEKRNIKSAWLAAGGYGSSSWEIHSGFLKWVLDQRLS